MPADANLPAVFAERVLLFSLLFVVSHVISILLPGRTCRLWLLFAAVLFTAEPAAAAPVPVDSAALMQARLDSLNASFHYQTGKVDLPGHFGYIDVPSGMRYLDSAQTRRVLTDLWGNPPAEASNTLGMLFPTSAGPVDEASWAFIVKYSDLGHVKDDDAGDIDYDDLLKEMQQETRDDNATRTAAGYPPVELMGWAAAPYYDKEHHVLHWAKTLRFGTDSANRQTLNYDVRVLGRKGVLSLMAVGSPAQLPVLQQQVPALITRTHFADGLEYADFDPGMDEVAAYSLGGLVAGKVLAKVGAFALILKFWKVLIAGAAGVWALVKRWFTGRKATSAALAAETADEPAPPAE